MLVPSGIHAKYPIPLNAESLRNPRFSRAFTSKITHSIPRRPNFKRLRSRMPFFPPRIFLLSSARRDGKRAHLLCHPVTMFPVARALHSTAGAPIGESFTLLSRLLFPGQLGRVAV